MSDITVIVPVWNGRDLLRDLLRSLRAQSQPAAEILVVDNGSSDGAPELAAESGARVIRMGRNAGFAAAVNRGIAEARTELLAIINSDVEAAPDWLQQLAAALRDPGAWFATGKILQSGDRTRLDGTWDVLASSGCAWRAGNGCVDGPEFSRPRRIFFPPGTAVLFRRELFRRVGAFDEAFESYLEDVDLGLRCALAGLGGWYVPEAVAFHRGSATLGRWHPRTVRLIARNQVLLVAKHYPRSCTTPVLIGQVLWGLVALRHGRGWSWLRGKAAGLRLFRSARANSRRADSELLQGILRQGDGEIRRLQAKSGVDPYWQWYLRLSRRGGDP